MADKTAMPGSAVMSRATPRRALQAARAEAAPRSPSIVGVPLDFRVGGRTVADAVLATRVAPQPYKSYTFVMGNTKGVYGAETRGLAPPRDADTESDTNKVFINGNAVLNEEACVLQGQITLKS